MLHFLGEHVDTIIAVATIVGLMLEFHRYVGITILKQIQTVHRTSQLMEYVYAIHLPHIEAALRKLCVRQGIDYEDVPPPPTGLMGD